MWAVCSEIDCGRVQCTGALRCVEKAIHNGSQCRVVVAAV